MQNRTSAVQPQRLRPCWKNILFLAAAHLIAVVAVLYLVFVRCSVWTLGLSFVWLMLCGLSITAGYHRHFAHVTHKAVWPVRLFYVLFGAASAQNSVLKWASDHRRHHAHTDEEIDPYNAQRGFWWSHVGWILFEDDHEAIDPEKVPDLLADPLVRFQHKWFVPLALFIGCAVPAAIGLLWGDPIGALLCAGFLRLAVQWHATFSINSVAHMIGTQPYSARCSARDSWITAIITLGEGYHNFHHRFPADYRNGVRWYHFDPTKWFVFLGSKVGLTRDLRRIRESEIEAARARAAARTPASEPTRVQAETAA